MPEAFRSRFPLPLAFLALGALLFVAAFAPTARAQETVVISQTLAHNSLNPAEATGLADATVIRTLYEGLVGFDQDYALCKK